MQHIDLSADLTPGHSRHPARHPTALHGRGRLALTLVLGLFLCLPFASSAAAHKLRVFATAEGATVTGYAFFVGGGRAAGAQWRAEDAAGRQIAQGETDAEGRYRFTPAPDPTLAPDPSADTSLTISVDTREGHVAQTRLEAARLLPLPSGQASEGEGAPQGDPALSPAPQDAAATPQGGAGPATTGPATGPGAALADEAQLRRALQQEIAPLRERIEEMDARMRLTDVISGLCLILGLAGAGLWLLGRRRG